MFQAAAVMPLHHVPQPTNNQLQPLRSITNNKLNNPTVPLHHTDPPEALVDSTEAVEEAAAAAHVDKEEPDHLLVFLKIRLTIRNFDI